MKHIITTILTTLTLTIAASAQTYQYGGHTYVKLGKATLAQAEEQAATLGGHLLVVNNPGEYAFANANLILRGNGWSWTGVSECDNMFKVDCALDYGVLSEMNKHWNGTIQQQPVGPGAVVVAGKFQATYRSTLWVAKFYQFDAGFAASQVANVIVEIE